MGSCFSSARQPAASEDGRVALDSAASVGSSSSSPARVRLSSRSWRERTRLKKKKEKRAGGRRSVEASAMASDLLEDELQRLPERMFVNGASEVACLYTQQGKKGTNQDAMIVWENFTLRSDTVFCGVFDGHGPFGHMVAKKVRDSLPHKLSSQWIANLFEHESPHLNGSRSGSMDSEEAASIIMDDDSVDANEREKVPEMYLPLKQSFLKAFKSIDKELKFHPMIDCFCSGTTAVTLIKQGQDLVIGNLGDSRAVMGTRDKDNNLLAVQLTVDLKPNLPREAARIQQCRGRVFALQDEPDVSRVWLPNNDSPGLAMARAFGDFCLKDYGLISVPDLSYRHLTEKDEFIVLATDGVWDVLSNKEVVDIVASAPNRGSSARALVDYAVRSWRLKFPTSKIDDCAAVCLFLENPSLTKPSGKEVPQNISQEPINDTTTVMHLADNEAGKQEIHGSVSSAAQNSSLVNSYSHHEEYEIVPVSEAAKVEIVPGRSQSTRSLSDCLTAGDEEDWTALEGLTRVNTLLNVPRFLSSDKRSASWRKWF